MQFSINNYKIYEFQIQSPIGMDPIQYIITYKKKQMVNNCNLLKYSTEKVNISISKQDIPFKLHFIVENIFSKFQKKQKKLH